LAIANQVWLGLLFLSLGAYIPGFFIVLLLSIAVSQVGLLPAAVYFFSQSRRLHRELSLRRAIVLSSAQRKEYLTHLKSFHDLHPEDLHLHQKYVEALLAAERHREAVVEARLVLRQDAYNFGASLLLAHAYFELGLYEACTATCNAYLAVTGYCFEFAELRSSCDRRMMGATA
jgi:hypothetical protein